VLRPAGQVRSLTELAVTDGFLANPSHQRGFRIGIDASIWFFHAAYGKEGENPELRTLFFRCCRLLQAPLLPLFVFDGPKRPAIKRGKRVGGSAHWLTQGMKNIIEAFGFEWRMAPGEAEAELAYLNSIGVIDAVLSDDVDNFLFGATLVIRNPSSTLSGNRSHPVKNAQGKDDGNHVLTYASSAILSTPSVALSRSGTILIALLSGGDYIPAGLPGCGQKFATGLARAGFGDSLVKSVKELKGSRLQAFLDQWRDEVRMELKTNKTGYLPSKKPSLAASLTDEFPSLPVLLSYIDPVISDTEPSSRGKNRPSPVVWRNDPDPMRIAALCELYFEWGVKDVIVSRFRTVLWPGIVCRAVRRGAMDADARGSARQCGTHDSDDEHVDPPGPSSPTKQISSTLSALALSSPVKSSAVPSIADPSTSTSGAPFSLSSLVPLTPPASTPASSNSTRSPSPSSSNSSPLLLSVLSHRTHPSTDATLEYRVLIDPTTLVARAESGVRGLRPPLVGGLFGIDPDEDGDEETVDEEDEGSGDKRKPKKAQDKKESPTTPLRLWLPACMIRAVAPEIVEAYEEKEREKEEKKAKRGTRGASGASASKVKSTG
ncbi:PIN domain-like protein, partial [Paxillus ammoniavirescens]